MKYQNIIFILILLAAGWFIFFNNSPSTQPETAENTQISQTQTTPTEQTATDTPQALNNPQEETAKYVTFSEEAFQTALTVEDGKTLLFYHANWCPTCRQLEKELNSEKIADLPANLTVLKVNYDNQPRELIERFGSVRPQHTMLQLDASGNEQYRWAGCGVATILQNLE